MNAKPFFAVSGTIFFIVGLAHLLRLFYQWPVQFGTWTVPHSLSYFGLVVPWALAFWAFRLRGAQRS